MDICCGMKGGEEDRYYDRWEDEHHEDMRPMSKVVIRNEAGEPLGWEWV